MTRAETNRRIGQECGIRAVEHESGAWYLVWPDGLRCSTNLGETEDQAWLRCCPPFDSDDTAILDACRRRLTSYEEMEDFCSHLRAVVVRENDLRYPISKRIPFCFYNASAKQRAEAFLLTTGDILP